MLVQKKMVYNGGFDPMIMVDRMKHWAFDQTKTYRTNGGFFDDTSGKWFMLV